VLEAELQSFQQISTPMKSHLDLQSLNAQTSHLWACAAATTCMRCRRQQHCRMQMPTLPEIVASVQLGSSCLKHTISTVECRDRKSVIMFDITTPDKPVDNDTHRVPSLRFVLNDGSVEGFTDTKSSTVDPANNTTCHHQKGMVTCLSRHGKVHHT